MAATFTWSIAPGGLMVQTLDGNPDTVVRVQVKVSATDGTHTADMMQMAELGAPVAGSFIPFADLTEAQVINWAKASLPQQGERVEPMLTRMLELKANPPIRPMAKPAPWNTCSQQ